MAAILVVLSFLVKFNSVEDIYLFDEIKDAKAYIDADWGTQLNSVGTVNVHLSGPGGSAEGMLYIINKIKQSKAKVVMKVEGSIASAHAVLALAGTEVQLPKHGYILFHLASGTNMVKSSCAGLIGIDRGLSIKQKCEEDLTALLKMYNDAAMVYIGPVLTTAEKQKLYAGHDLIFSFDELRARLEKVNGKH